MYFLNMLTAHFTGFFSLRSAGGPRSGRGIPPGLWELLILITENDILSNDYRHFSEG